MGNVNLRRLPGWVFSILLVLAPSLTFAQGPLPCNDQDPYGNCPLDTNVWILAIIALVAGAVFLYKQQKAQQQRT